MKHAMVLGRLQLAPVTPTRLTGEGGAAELDDLGSLWFSS